VNRSRELGAIAYHVERPDDLDPSWFARAGAVGVTAGTSTLDESVRAVVDRLQQIAADRERPALVGRLTAAMP